MKIETEKLYTVNEVAEAMRLSDETIRRWFRDEPGVLKHSSPKSRFKRPYTTLLIPDSVFRRVWNRMSRAA